MTFPSIEAPDYVDAELFYLQPTDAKPVTYSPAAAPTPAPLPPAAEAHAVRITNARKAGATFSLDQNGFELHAHRSEVADFSDEQLIRERYYPESEALLRKLTGASRVVTFDHTLRFGQKGHDESGVREPVRRVHNDQTFISAPRRVRDHVAREDAELRLSRRFAIINLWRPIGVPAVSTPLALCDARSITPRELIPTDLVYPDKVGETYSFLFSPEHRWHYFSAVQPDEVLLLEIYDSSTDGIARLTAHTAFDDPTTRPDAPPRRSIELRTLVFW
jgi:hypothetical protein